MTVRDDGRPSLSSTTRVVIAVADINDHGPEFEQKFYTVQIPASPSTDKPLFQVSYHLRNYPKIDLRNSIRPSSWQLGTGIAPFSPSLDVIEETDSRLYSVPFRFSLCLFVHQVEVIPRILLYIHIIRSLVKNHPPSRDRCTTRPNVRMPNRREPRELEWTIKEL